MFEIDDCDDFLCGGARPPDFMIPPPPMSAELQAMLAPTFKCSEDDPMDTADMCHAIPVSFIFFFLFFFSLCFRCGEASIFGVTWKSRRLRHTTFNQMNSLSVSRTEAIYKPMHAYILGVECVNLFTKPHKYCANLVSYTHTRARMMLLMLLLHIFHGLIHTKTHAIYSFFHKPKTQNALNMYAMAGSETDWNTMHCTRCTRWNSDGNNGQPGANAPIASNLQHKLPLIAFYMCFGVDKYIRFSAGATLQRWKGTFVSVFVRV